MGRAEDPRVDTEGRVDDDVAEMVGHSHGRCVRGCPLRESLGTGASEGGTVVQGQRDENDEG